VLLKVLIFYDITPFKLVTNVSKNRKCIGTSVDIYQFTRRNFLETLILSLKLYITYIPVMILIFILHGLPLVVYIIKV
jgi:hypothetical protein